MPLLDVSDLLFDPDFQTSFTVTRNTQSIGANGLALVSTVITPNVSGVVEAQSGAQLVRTPDDEMIVGDIVVTTRFPLTDGAGATDADIVTWNGRDYIAANIDDWSQFGAGYIRAICKIKKLSP